MHEVNLHQYHLLVILVFSDFGDSQKAEEDEAGKYEDGSIVSPPKDSLKNKIHN